MALIHHAAAIPVDGEQWRLRMEMWMEASKIEPLSEIIRGLDDMRIDYDLEPLRRLHVAPDPRPRRRLPGGTRMSTFNDGGSAFPHNELTSTGEIYHDHLGMSLRDYFAGQALAGMMARKYSDELTTREISCGCYLLADAMLKSRKART
jgi:hypothetical protein